jgi:hypothetical protein
LDVIGLAVYPLARRKVVSSQNYLKNLLVVSVGRRLNVREYCRQKMEEEEKNYIYVTNLLD